MAQAAGGKGERDPCEDTGELPRIDAQHDGADDLADSSEGEPDDGADDELHAVYDELAAELAEHSDERTRSDTPVVAAPVKPTTGRGSTTRFDPLAETADPDAEAAAQDKAETERIAASTVADVVASASDLRATEAAALTSSAVRRASARPPVPTPVAPVAPLTPVPIARPRIDEGRPPPRRDPTPSSPRTKVLIGLVGVLPLALAGALVAVGAPQAAWQRMSGRDHLEPNETIAQARPIAEGVTAHLTCSPGDVDWFKVEAPAGRALLIDVSPASIGRGGASLHRPDGVCVASSRQSATDDRVVFAPEGGAEGPLLLRVWGARGEYEVQVRAAPLDARFEPNDAPAEASPLAPGVTRAVRCNGTDWFRVHVPARHTASARLLAGPPGLSVAWGALEGVGSVMSSRDAQARAVGADRLALLQVTGDTGPYELEVSLQAPGADARTGAEDGGTLIEPGEYPALTCSGVDLWRLSARAGQVVDVSLRQAGDPWSIDVDLLDPSWSSLPASESRQTQGATSTTRLVYQARRDGEVVLRVSGQPIDYALTVHVGASPQSGAPPAPINPNANRRNVARLIGPGVYPDEFVNGEAWFQLDVAQGQRVSVALDFSAAQGEVQMELYDGQYSLISASANSGVDQAQLDHQSTSAQSLFLRVYGYGQANRYTLTVAYDGSAAAQTLEPGRHEGLVCPGNSVFRVAAPGGKRLVVELAFEGAEGDLDLQLLDGEGATLVESETFAETDGERVEYTPPVDQELTVRVHNAKNTFTLDLRVEEP